MDILQLKSVNKSYNSIHAVSDISLDVPGNTIFGLLGPNGAGKTTTMRMIMNIIAPDSGEIILFGEPFRESLKNRIGYLPEERGLYPKMKLLALLRFLGEMKGLSPGRAKQLAEEWLERFDLGPWASKRIQELSKGMQQKVQFISAVLHSPDLLIVDEPFSGLDPVNTKFLRDILLEMKSQGKAIILSTHLMDQAEKLCDAICLINHGKVVVQGTLPEIKQKYRHNSVVLEFFGDTGFLSGYPEIRRINNYGKYLELQLEDDYQPQKLFKKLAGTDLEIRKFEVSETSLNEIFLELVEIKNV